MLEREIKRINKSLAKIDTQKLLTETKRIKKDLSNIKGDKNMSNTFMDALEAQYNYKFTENGAIAHRSTGSKVYDMFALGGAYRSRSEEDCMNLFKNAFEEDTDLALKCLFYLRDCRGGKLVA